MAHNLLRYFIFILLLVFLVCLFIGCPVHEKPNNWDIDFDKEFRELCHGDDENDECNEYFKDGK